MVISYLKIRLGRVLGVWGRWEFIFLVFFKKNYWFFFLGGVFGVLGVRKRCGGGWSGVSLENGGFCLRMVVRKLGERELGGLVIWSNNGFGS